MFVDRRWQRHRQSPRTSWNMRVLSQIIQSLCFSSFVFSVSFHLCPPGHRHFQIFPFLLLSLIYLHSNFVPVNSFHEHLSVIQTALWSLLRETDPDDGETLLCGTRWMASLRNLCPFYHPLSMLLPCFFPLPLPLSLLLLDLFFIQFF